MAKNDPSYTNVTEAERELLQSKSGKLIGATGSMSLRWDADGTGRTRRFILHYGQGRTYSIYAQELENIDAQEMAGRIVKHDISNP